jgi:hypothetical protein
MVWRIDVGLLGYRSPWLPLNEWHFVGRDGTKLCQNKEEEKIRITEDTSCYISIYVSPAGSMSNPKKGMISDHVGRRAVVS